MTTATTRGGKTYDICDSCQHWMKRVPTACKCGCHGDPSETTWEDDG